MKNSSTSSSKVFLATRGSRILILALKEIAFLALGLCIWVALAEATSHLGGPESTLEYRVNDLLKNHRDVEAIAVGHSHNMALDFSVLGIDGYHAWDGGSDVFEVEYELRSLVPKLHNLRAVFMPMAYWGFVRDNSAVPERRVRNLDYYRAFHSGPISASDRWLYLRASSWNIVRSDHWKVIVEAVLRHKGDTTLPAGIDPADGHSIQSDDFKPMSYEELVEYTKSDPAGVKAHLDIQDACKAGHANLAKDTYTCVVRIIKFLQTRGIRVIFFTPPYFATYTELYYPETIRSMKARMEELVDEYAVEYYDFSTDKDLIHNNLLFKNDDHLDADGAVVFSKKLRAAMHAHEAVDDL